MNLIRYFLVSVLFILGMTTKVYALPAFMKITVNSASAPDYSIWKFLYSIFAFVLILSITYYVTKLLAKKGTVKAKSKHMKVIESLPVGIDKSIVLMKVGKQYLFLSNQPKSLTFMTSFEEDELGLVEAINEEDYEISYETYLSKLNDREDSIFSSKLKNNLARLKSMVRGTGSDE